MGQNQIHDRGTQPTAQLPAKGSVTGGLDFCYSPASTLAFQSHIGLTYGISFLICLTSIVAIMSRRNIISCTQHSYVFTLQEYPIF